MNDPETGLSPYPGNINQLVFKLEPYISNLKKSNGVLGEFVNPKYADGSRQRFKKPTRLECMMQDYPKTLSSGARVGFSTAPAWLWSPCKNNAADARASVEAGIPAGSAMTAESDYLRYPLEFLRILGAHVAIAPPETFLGITASLTPRAVFHPSFAIFFSEVASRFPFPAKVFISERASLLIKGNVIIESLDLDGAVRFEASPGTTLIVRAGSRKISNAGHRVRECSPAASEVLQMRGYVFERVAEEVVRTEGSEGVFVFTGRVLISEASYEPDNVGSTPPASCFSCC